MAPRAGTRASDTDRNKAVDALADAFSDGQITQAEYDTRSQTALRAPTLAELHGLTRDLQVRPTLVGESAGVSLPPTHVTPGSLDRVHLLPWIFRAAIVGALIVTCLWGYQTVSGLDFGSAETASTSTAGSPDTDVRPLVLPGPPRLLTAVGFDSMLHKMRREIGSTVVSSLNVYNAYASFDARRPGSPGTYTYYFDGFLGIPSHNETADDGGDRVDLTTIDYPKVLGILKTLPQRANLPHPTQRYLVLDAGAGRTPPSVDVYITNGERAAYVICTLDGEITYRYLG